MQYRSHRYQTQYPIQLSTPTGRQQCRITDVNNTGAQIMGSRGLRRGDKIRFRVLNNDLSAVVCWAVGERIGIVFRPQLTGVQVDTLRYRRDGARNQMRGAVGFTHAHY